MSSREDQSRNQQTNYAGYRVFDEHYEEIGKVDDLFVDENDQPEYIGVKMGFLGMKSTLIPMDIVRANDKREILEVAASKEAIKNAPSFDDHETVSPEHETEIRQYYGLTSNVDVGRRSGYAPSDYSPGKHPDVDPEYGERGRTQEPLGTSRPEAEERPLGEPSSASTSSRGRGVTDTPSTTDEDELRIQRTEEELRAGTREREAGAVNVRRRTRTDRERLRVPKKREEVTVERVPVGDETTPGSAGQSSAPVDSGEEEIRIPVVEEEVVVEKRPVVKEELRIRKSVVEEEEVVEEELRKEEIDIEGERHNR